MGEEGRRRGGRRPQKGQQRWLLEGRREKDGIFKQKKERREGREGGREENEISCPKLLSRSSLLPSPPFPLAISPRRVFLREREGRAVQKIEKGQKKNCRQIHAIFPQIRQNNGKNISPFFQTFCILKRVGNWAANPSFAEKPTMRPGRPFFSGGGKGQGKKVFFILTGIQYRSLASILMGIGNTTRTGFFFAPLFADLLLVFSSSFFSVGRKFSLLRPSILRSSSVDDGRGGGEVFSHT